MSESSHNRRFPASFDARIRFLVAALAVGGLAGCQGAKPPDAYAGDIAKLCDVVERSGAATLVGSDRMYTVATWLGANLETPEARGFLSRIQPLDGEAKANALDAEAQRVGLAGCALAADWRKPHP